MNGLAALQHLIMKLPSGSALRPAVISELRGSKCDSAACFSGLADVNGSRTSANTRLTSRSASSRNRMPLAQVGKTTRTRKPIRSPSPDALNCARDRSIGRSTARSGLTSSTRRNEITRTKSKLSFVYKEPSLHPGLSPITPSAFPALSALPAFSAFPCVPISASFRIDSS